VKDGSIHEVEQIMCEPIPWAKGLPLKAEGFETEYYRKD
jgi:DNA polymerase bacteriophage-type